MVAYFLAHLVGLKACGFKMTRNLTQMPTEHDPSYC